MSLPGARGVWKVGEVLDRGVRPPMYTRGDGQPFSEGEVFFSSEGEAGLKEGCEEVAGEAGESAPNCQAN